MRLSLTVQTPEVPVTIPVALLSGAFEEKLRKAAALDVQGVELVTSEPAALDLDWIIGLLRQNRLAISAIASGAMAPVAGLTLLDPDPSVAFSARQRLDELVTLAGRVGAPIVTVGSFRGRMHADRNLALVQFADILRSAADHAAAVGVRIAVEPLNRFESDLIHTIDQGLSFLEQVDHPAVGLLVDTFHVNIEESSWTEPFRRAAAAGKLLHIHVGDNNRLAPGRGLIDFHAILQTLGEIGYSGWLTAELLALPDPDTAARETIEVIARLLRETSSPSAPDRPS
jgi:5-keto-L-gluconate epimerase